MSINVAIVGIGNVASALIQGVELYKANKDVERIGIMNEITEFSIEDINFVLGFDVNCNKVGKDLSQAIYCKPNCANIIYNPPSLNAPVLKGDILDGLDSNLCDHVPTDENQPVVNVKEELQKRNVDVLVNVIPTGSHKAARYYADQALEAGCAVVNGMPSLIANDPQLVSKAEALGLPLIGDDVKSQIGATIIHRALSHLFPIRGAIMDMTLQLDWGGDMDFCNLMSNNRYEEGKRQSKTEAVIDHLPNKDVVDCQISAVDYVPFLKNQKEAYTRIEGRIFGGQHVRVDLLMQVQDGYNSAGILTDAIRVAAIGKKRNVGGVLHSACSLFNKKPPIQTEDWEAKINLVKFLNNEREF